MKHLSLLTLLLSLGLMTANSPIASADSSTQKKNCSDSISGLILNPGCNSPELTENNKKKLCKYKDQSYEIGEIYLKVSSSSDSNIRFIRLESGKTFSTSKGSGDVGDNVLVIWNEKNDEPYVEIFHPTWISHLVGISLSDKSINKVIEQYKRGESIESFCP